MAVTVEATPDELILRVQELQDALDAQGESTARDLAQELVSAIVQMYGAGLEQIVALVAARPDQAERDELAQAFAHDPLVAALLMIHDLHPVPLEDRVRQALERVRPYMESHGGNVELLSCTEGVARIRLEGSCRSCRASAATLELAIKQALEDTAPDLEALEVDGVDASPAGTPALSTLGPPLPMASAVPAPGAIELPLTMVGPPAAPSWFELTRAGSLAAGELLAAQVAGQELVIANVDGTLLAYRDACAGCGAALHGGVLDAGALRCRSCGREFVLPRAGRCDGDDSLQLQPVPLLWEDGCVKVALAAA